MKRSKFTEEQIIAILREQEAGSKTAEVCRRHGISGATFYAWKAKFSGTELLVEQVRCRNGEQLAVVRGQAASPRSRPEGLGAHQPLDPMQATVNPLGQNIAPDAPRTIGAVAGNEARPHLRADLFVFPAAL
jgi:putative transposase